MSIDVLIASLIKNERKALAARRVALAQEIDALQAKLDARKADRQALLTSIADLDSLASSLPSRINTKEG
jgi:cell division protein FtsB